MPVAFSKNMTDNQLFKYIMAVQISSGIVALELVINGFSKGFAMTGWRLGYICGPQIIMEQMVKIHQYAILCAPTNSQYAAIEGLKNCDDEIQKMRTAYNERRRYLMHTFKEMGLRCFEPFGAFYVFPCISEFGMTSEQFATELLNTEKLAVVPGTAFGDCGEGFIRKRPEKEMLSQSLRLLLPRYYLHHFSQFLCR